MKRSSTQWFTTTIQAWRIDRRHGKALGYPISKVLKADCPPPTPTAIIWELAADDGCLPATLGRAMICRGPKPLARDGVTKQERTEEVIRSSREAMRLLVSFSWTCPFSIWI
jgi:hypothetical protein